MKFISNVMQRKQFTHFCSNPRFCMFSYLSEIQGDFSISRISVLPDLNKIIIKFASGIFETHIWKNHRNWQA